MSLKSSTGHLRIVFYIVLVIAAAWIWLWSFRLGFHPPEWVAIFVLMWIPGSTAIVFRIMFGEGFTDVGWRIGKARFWAWAYLTALASHHTIAGFSVGNIPGSGSAEC